MKMTEEQKERYLARQPKGKKYLAVLYTNAETEDHVFEPILRDEDEAKQMSGVTVFVEDESRLVVYRLLEELVESYWKIRS